MQPKRVAASDLLWWKLYTNGWRPYYCLEFINVEDYGLLGIDAM